MEKKVENVIIIGSGPAGFTAAIYAARANLEPLMIEGYESGGQLMTTTEVENYPGFVDGIMGPELMTVMRKQAERFQTRFITKNVTKVDFSTKPFKVWVDQDLYEAKTVIICTGASAKYLGLESEKRLLGRGVSACATCDGAFFKDQEVCVVGGGDTAMEEANFLTRFAKHVHIIHRRNEFRASKIMVDRALKNPKISVIYNSELAEVVGEKGVTGIKVRNTETGDVSEMAMDGVFIAIGHKPNTDLFKDQIETNDVGYILTKGKSTYTSVSGVFAAGDVQDPIYRQAVSAAGSGCMAAIDAERWLESQEENH
ncbi:MAG: thioredoxin-disulfide reductase [Bdellovibrionaceae bacterium]|nr:thioredoxin-disulfide reductase [Pseudobdellovibrionaceae bacterium]